MSFNLSYSAQDLDNAIQKANQAAPQSTTYTKAEVDTALAGKANTADLGTAATKNMDSSLSSTSENPVQNNVLYEKFLDIDANLAAIRVMMDAHLYGFRISKTDSNPNTRVEYLYDAVGKTPASMNVSTGVFDYGSWGNDWFVSGNKPCALKFDGSLDYYLDPTDYTKKEDGTDSDLYVLLTSEPADWSSGYKNYFTKVDNSFVNVTGDTAPTFASDTYYSNSAYAGNFEAQIPLSYVKRWEDDSWWYTAISDKQVTPDFKADAHKDENGTIHDYFYAPMFKGCIVDDKLRSIAGVTPQGNTTGSQENTAATTCGAGWQLWDWSKHELISDLLILMSKSTDSQTSFGQGDTNTYNASDTVTHGKLPTGTSGSGQFWGGTDKQHVKVFHIEDFWGNRWDRCLGLNLVNDVYVYKLTRPYALDTDSTYINSGLAAPAEGWQTASYIGDFGRFPKTIGGSSSTFDCDYFWKNASRTQLALFGGDCANGLRCGSRFVALDNGSSISYWSLGGSPCYLGTSA